MRFFILLYPHNNEVLFLMSPFTGFIFVVLFSQLFLLPLFYFITITWSIYIKKIN